MSLFGLMKTSISGMNAQSNKISTISDNVANQSTTGYKRASTEFASLVLGGNKNSYDSGGVSSLVRYSISQQGPISYTTSGSDLAIKGNGFFPVRDASGTNALTRAGAFVPTTVTNDSGESVTQLINTAGFKLLGQKLPATGLPGSLSDAQLVPIEFSTAGLKATVSTSGTLKANLPALAAIPAAGAFNAQTSITAYDPLGTPITLDITYAKTALNTWSITVKDRGDATITPPRAASTVKTGTLTFNGTTGAVATGGTLSMNVPHATMSGVTFPLTLDLSGMTQLGEEYTPYEGTVNGNAPSALDTVEFGSDGTVFEVYKNGARNPVYRVPLASVASPDRLSVETGNVYSETQDSGSVQFGEAESLGFGSIESGALEGSNVDLGSELADMIQAQSAYTANSKVFQTGSELIDTLVNLKR